MATTTCQICGRDIKANTGKIALHGYKRPHPGYQTSSCRGARHLPYEISCDLLPKEIAIVQNYIETATNRMNAMIAEPPATLTYSKYAGATKPRIETVVSKPEDFTFDSSRDYRMDSYSTIYHKQITEIKQFIRMATTDLEYLKNRLANWKAPAEVK